MSGLFINSIFELLQEDDDPAFDISISIVLLQLGIQIAVKVIQEQRPDNNSNADKSQQCARTNATPEMCAVGSKCIQFGRANAVNRHLKFSQSNAKREYTKPKKDNQFE